MRAGPSSRAATRRDEQDASPRAPASPTGRRGGARLPRREPESRPTRRSQRGRAQSFFFALRCRRASGDLSLPSPAATAHIPPSLVARGASSCRLAHAPPPRLLLVGWSAPPPHNPTLRPTTHNSVRFGSIGDCAARAGYKNDDGVRYKMVSVLARVANSTVLLELVSQHQSYWLNTSALDHAPRRYASKVGGRRQRREDGRARRGRRPPPNDDELLSWLEGGRGVRMASPSPTNKQQGPMTRRVRGGLPSQGG